MKIFHSHSFEHTSAMYKEAFQKIIVEHNLNHEVTLQCKCGETKKSVVSLNLHIEDNEK